MVDVGLGLIAIGLFALIFGLAWLDYKKQKENPQQVDPVSKGIMLALLVSGMLFMAEAFAFFEKDWNREHFWVHLVIVVVVVGIFVLIAKRKNPMPYYKQKEIVKNFIESEYFAEDYIGDANITWLNVFKVTKEGHEDEAQAGNFYVEVRAEDVLKIWCKINVFTGQLLHLQKNPPLVLENNLLGQSSPYTDPLSKQFDDNAEPNTEST